MRKFKELRIWEDSIQLVKDVYTLGKLMPSNEKFGLISQVQRAAVSIPSNIAEGSSRKSDIEFARFLEISLGSAFELETQLILILELQLINQSELITKLLSQVEKIQKMASSFISKIR